RKMIPLATWVFGGIAVAAFGTEAYFGLSGLSDRSNAMHRCAPNCAPSERDSIQTKFIIADVALGAGIVSAGLATYFFLRSRGVTTANTAVDVVPRAGGGVATVSGRF
ncbi:MAG: hypothetical protein M3O46_06960, partial [Myxococcota bacterium]|nr:hypothetical protein [Myxococcota bacterium]